jgi:hypothetical protein
MDPATLRAAILSGPHAEQCVPWVLLPGPKRAGIVPRDYDQQIADLLSGQLRELTPRQISRADVLAECGILTGGGALAALEASSSDYTGVILSLLDQGALPIGHPETLEALAACGLPAPHLAALTALASRPVHITAEAVSQALRGAE